MKLNPDLPFGKDYSTIALALFLQEQGMQEGKLYNIGDYSCYLYRFYSDIIEAKEKHYYKIINEIWHYQPSDIYDYSKSILKYVEENIGLVYVCGESFYVVGCPEGIDKYVKLVQGVIQTLVIKYIGSDYKTYDSRINVDEFIDKRIFRKESRVFYRALETMNYCFISDELELDQLCAVELTSKDEFDISNYLILGKEYGELFLDGSLEIKKNGYPYINGQRKLQHLDIRVLRKVRQNLTDI